MRSLHICDSWLSISLSKVVYCPFCGELGENKKEHILRCYNSKVKIFNEPELTTEQKCDETCEISIMLNVNSSSNSDGASCEKNDIAELNVSKDDSADSDSNQTKVGESEQSEKSEILKDVTTSKSCDVCGRSFKSSYHLKTHIAQVHENLKLEKCNVCGKCFRERTSLKNHILSHTGERPFSCNKCNKSYRRKESLIYHQQSHDKDTPRSYICAVCAKNFRNLRDLKGHERLMHGGSDGQPGQIQFQCKECDLILKNKTSLTNHMKVQHGLGTLYNCSFCDQKFPTNTHLKNHASSHTGVKPYPCQYCPKTFRMGYLRSVHEQRHTRTGAHKCLQCNRSFPQASEVKRHMNTVHNAEKFSCDSCDKLFKSNDLLTKHFQKIHVDKGMLTNEPREDKSIYLQIPTAAQQPPELVSLSATPVELATFRLPSAPVELTGLKLPSAPGGPLQTISVKTEKLRTINDTITTKTVYVMDPDVPDSDNNIHTGVSSIINLPYTLGVPHAQYASHKKVGARVVIPGDKYILTDQEQIIQYQHQK